MSEHQEQAAFVAWMRAQHPGVLVFAIPNGAHLAGSPRQRAAQMARLKAEGLTAGVPDLYIPTCRLWIEMKAGNGRVSGAQRAMHQYLRMIGDQVEVCVGADEAMAAVRFHLGPFLGDSR